MKVLCSECDWVGRESHLLKEDHPFRDGDKIYGCPQCHEASTTSAACDEPGCKREGTNGTPTPEGYRHTCYEHRPEKARKVTDG